MSGVKVSIVQLPKKKKKKATWIFFFFIISTIWILKILFNFKNLSLFIIQRKECLHLSLLSYQDNLVVLSNNQVVIALIRHVKNTTMFLYLFYQSCDFIAQSQPPKKEKSCLSGLSCLSDHNFSFIFCLQFFLKYII